MHKHSSCIRLLMVLLIVNILCFPSISLESNSYPRIEQVKLELEAIIRLLQSVKPNLSDAEQINLVKKITDWILKNRPLICSMDLKILEPKLSEGVPKKDLPIAQGLIEFARYSKSLSIKDIYAILSYQIDLILFQFDYFRIDSSSENLSLISEEKDTPQSALRQN